MRAASRAGSFRRGSVGRECVVARRRWLQKRQWLVSMGRVGESSEGGGGILVVVGLDVMVEVR